MKNIGITEKALTVIIIGLMLFSLQFLNNNAREPSEVYSQVIDIEQTKNPIFLNIIWHQHQPTYKDPSTNIYEQPWVYMHSTNSYPWMADLQKNNPTINATINITPSLLRQLSDYTSEVAYDRRIETAKILESQMSDENKTIILRFFFDINPQFVSGRYAVLQAKSNANPTMAEKIAAFTDGELLDLKVMFFLRWINPEYRSVGPNGNFRLATIESRIDGGNNQTNQFDRSDLDYVLQKGLELAQSTVQRYIDAINQGNLEMITTPFYHPILPLLVDLESARASSGNEQLALPVQNTGWLDDAQEQIDRGVQSYIDTYTGAPPKGMWPSEQAISKEVVPLLDNAGIEWFASDKVVLQNSLGVSNLTPEQLYRMYAVNEGASTVASVFRDTRLSDQIGFAYSGLHPDDASARFVDEIKDIYDQLDTNQEDYLVTVSLDGENAWEHYQFDIDGDGKNEYTGNLFRELLYEKLAAAQTEGWFKTITPSQYLKDHPVNTLPVINNLASGSWIGGELNTWIGEPDENIAWDWLIDAREALVAADLASTTVDSPAAWDALYAAEGSDWFWWYGSDQDSGRDELFDWGFKTLLRSVYGAIGLTDDEILAINPLLFLQEKAQISASYPAKMSGYTMDGIASSGEWAQSFFINDDVVENDPITGFYSGINEEVSDLLFRVDLTTDVNRGSNNDLLGLYFNNPRASTGGIYPLGVAQTIDNTLGFKLNFALTFSFNDSTLSFWTNDGSGWVKGVAATATAALDGDVFEISIPLDFFDYTPGDFFQLGVYYTGNPSDVAPEDGPISFQVPIDVDFNVIFEMTDPEGDEYGAYPLSPDFAPGFGLFDILDLKVGYDEENFVVSLELDEISNIWNSPAGFSHPLIQVYIDKDRVSGSGNTQPDQNPQVVIHEDFAWETMIRADGWLQYGVLQNTSQFSGVVTQADLLNSRITIQAPLSIIGTPTADWAYVVLIGSQDFQAFRERDSLESTWRLGGGVDGPYDPHIIDMLVPEGIDQNVILNDWDVATMREAKMIGVGPNVQYGLDTIAPEVDITSPVDSTLVSFDSNGEASVEITFTAMDNNAVDHFNLFLGSILKLDNQPLVSGENTVTVTFSSTEVLGDTVTIRINVYDGINEANANFGTDSVVLSIERAQGSDDSNDDGLPLNSIVIFITLFVLIPILRSKKN